MITYYVVGNGLPLLGLTNNRFEAALRTANETTQAAAYPAGELGLFAANPFPLTHSH